MQIETEIEVNFRTTLGDNFEDDEDTEGNKKLIEQHIQDYCEEHKIDRHNVKIISYSKA